MICGLIVLFIWRDIAEVGNFLLRSSESLPYTSMQLVKLHWYTWSTFSMSLYGRWDTRRSVHGYNILSTQLTHNRACAHGANVIPLRACAVAASTLHSSWKLQRL